MARTLDALRRHYRWSDRELGERAGYSRNKVEERRNGVTAIDADDLTRFSVAFGVPILVLVMDADEAVRWVLDHGPTPGRWEDADAEARKPQIKSLLL